MSGRHQGATTIRPFRARPSGGGLLAALLLLSACAEREVRGAGRAAQEPRNVVLIVVDTLRADRLGCYGYELDTSPHIDALAAEGVLFEANSSQCNATLPSITSIMTGVYPRTHGDYLPVPIGSKLRAGAGIPSIAERLQAEGWHTVCVNSHPAWHGAELDSAVFRGWERFSGIPARYQGPERRHRDHAAYTNERLFPQLDEWAQERSDQRLFLFAHYFDPHMRYRPPPEHRGRFLRHHLAAIGAEELTGRLLALDLTARSLTDEFLAAGIEHEEPRELARAVRRAMYDAEIAYCDEHVGRLLARLGELGVAEETAVVLLSDHGENLALVDRPGFPTWEFNHDGLFDAVVHVPLIWRLPGARPGRVAALSQSIDLHPTLTDLLGLAPTPGVEGRSLVPLLEHPDGAVHERVFVESKDHVEKAVRDERWKLLERGAGVEPMVFRWREDAAEARDVAAELDPEEVEALRAHLDAFRPTDVLHLRVAAGPEPFEASVRVRGRVGLLVEAAGPADGRLDERGSGYRWSGRVEDDDVEVVLRLRERGRLLVVDIALGGANAWEGTWLGRTPVAETSAIPIPIPAGEPAPEDAAVALGAGEGNERALRLRLEEDRRAVLEVRRRSDVRGDVPELVGAQGLEPFEAVTSYGAEATFVSAANGPVAAEASVRFAQQDELRHLLVRLDGRWPAPDEIDLDGQAVRADHLRFLLPYAADARVTAALVAPLPRELQPPRSVTLWLEGASGAVDIDAGSLSEGELEELRALGYVR